MKTENQEFEQIKVTKELVDKLDLYNCDPNLRNELARLCMYANGGETQALNTAYMGLRSDKHRTKFSDIFKTFGQFIQMEFEQLRNNYLHICKRDHYLLKYDDNISGKCLVGIDKDLKLMFCYYKKSTDKFYDGLHDGANEVHPIAFFQHVNIEQLIMLINKDY